MRSPTALAISSLPPPPFRRLCTAAVVSCRAVTSCSMSLKIALTALKLGVESKFQPNRASSDEKASGPDSASAKGSNALANSERMAAMKLELPMSASREISSVLEPPQSNRQFRPDGPLDPHYCCQGFDVSRCLR